MKNLIEISNDLRDVAIKLAQSGTHSDLLRATEVAEILIDIDKIVYPRA